jgi:hypothetical protein
MGPCHPTKAAAGADDFILIPKTYGCGVDRRKAGGGLLREASSIIPGRWLWARIL